MTIHDKISSSMNLDILYFDVLLEIIKYLSLDDLINLSKVNKAMFSVTTSNHAIKIFEKAIILRFTTSRIKKWVINMHHTHENINNVLRSDKLFRESELTTSTKIVWVDKNQVKQIFDSFYDDMFGMYGKFTEIMDQTKSVKLFGHGTTHKYLRVHHIWIN